MPLPQEFIKLVLLLPQFGADGGEDFVVTPRGRALGS